MKRLCQNYRLYSKENITYLVCIWGLEYNAHMKHNHSHHPHKYTQEEGEKAEGDKEEEEEERQSEKR